MTQEQKVKRKRRFAVYLLKTFLVIMLLFGLLTLMLQFSGVQNWISKKATSFISEKTNTNVSIEEIDVSINKGVQLKGFLITTIAEGDTIISAKSLNVGLAKSLTSAIRKEYDFSKISLDGPNVNVITKRGHQSSNINDFIKLLSSSEPKKKDNSEPAIIKLEEIDINNLSLSIIDENKNTRQTFTVGRLEVSIDKLLEDGKLWIDEIILDRPIVRINKLGDSYEFDSESKKITAIVDTVSSSKDSLWIKLGSLDITNGVFSMADAKSLSKTNYLDYKNFEFSEINLSSNNIQYKEGPQVNLDVDNFSFIDDKGLRVEQLKSSSISISNKEIALSDFILKTKKSLLTRDLSFSFNSFSDFSEIEKKVKINAAFDNSKVYLGDLLHFVGDLKKSPFFKENKNRTVYLSGRFDGSVDRLSGRNVEINVDNKMALKANFTTRNLTVKDRELINFGVKELSTNMAFLQELIPGFNAPANFYKMGDINFRGRFDGYIKDFVAFGSLNTAMGDAILDMRLDTKGGIELANYSGDLSLEDFDLRNWSDNDDFGIANFSASIENGKGLTLNSINTELNAIIESISYKGYEYRDFLMDGKLSQNQFDGEFSITDENIDLIFDGNVQLKDSVPYLDFKANIEKIDLEMLNLSKKPFELRGNIDINGNGSNINNLLGTVLASDLAIATNDTLYTLDTLSLTSTATSQSNTLDFYSDIAQVHIQGAYDLNHLIPSFKKLLKQNYPHYTQNWKVQEKDLIVYQNIDFGINVSDTKNILELAGVKELQVRNLKGKGKLNTAENQLDFDGVIPYVGYKNNLLNDIKLKLTSNEKKGDLNIQIDSTYWGDKKYNPIVLESIMTGDTVDVFIGTTELADSLEKLEIGAQIVPNEKGYKVKLADKKIEMLGKEWTFLENNNIVFGENYIDIENLNLTDGDRSITIDDINNKGLKVGLGQFDFKTLNGSVINYRPMYFAGIGDLNVEIEDLFTDDKTLKVDLLVPKFTVNGDDYGEFRVEAEKPTNKPFDAYIHIGNNEQGLFVDGFFDPERDNYLDVEVRAEDFNMGIFEYILKDGMKNVAGQIDLRGNVEGPVNDLKVDAEALLNNAGLTVVYTGVHYTFDKQMITCSEKFIDFTGATLIDANGNSGVITGGIYHDAFTNFGLKANISGDDVIAVNTKKEDNDFYYGYAKGAVSVDFAGPFDRIDMKIECTTKQGTKINIPISDGQTASDKNFIEFINKEELDGIADESIRDFKIEGLDIEIDLELTEAAQVNLIFDEEKGDIIQGSGNGDLKIYITRYNDFEIYGNYEIAQGDYLFTAWGLVAKPFDVRRGSQIRWTGDPVNAELAIKADYTVRTPMSVFLSEYLVDGSSTAAQANSRTEVDLILDLGGTLYKPTVNFDLDFPNIQGELASVADNKMRSLRTNQSELNNQVLGLVVFNTFFPSNSSGSTAGADLGAAGVSTLSEFLSSQLSILFTGLINDALAEDGLISGIDFEIGLNKNSFNGVNQSSNDILPDEIEVNLKNRFRFLDERLSLGVGGNYVRQSVLNTNNNYFVGDFVIEYFLSSDRKLKLKVYGKYDYDENFISSSRRQKYGVGIGYRTEFGSLTEFKENFKETIQEVKEQ